MMKNRFLPILLLTAALSVCSCDRPAIEIDSPEKEQFLDSKTPGLYAYGKVCFIYDSDRHQKAENRSRKQFRIQTNEQDSCMNVYLEAFPRSTGVHIPVQVDYRDPDHIISHTALMECSRRSGSMIWMWDAPNRTGILLNIAY